MAWPQGRQRLLAGEADAASEDAEGHGGFQRAGEGCVEGPAWIGVQGRVLPAIGMRTSRIAEGIEAEIS